MGAYGERIAILKYATAHRTRDDTTASNTCTNTVRTLYTVPYTAWPGVIDGFGRYRARALEMHHFTIFNRYNFLLQFSLRRVHERIIVHHLNDYRLLSAPTRNSAPALSSTSMLAAKPMNFVIALGCALSMPTTVNTSHLQDNAASEPRVMLSIHL